MEDLNNASDEGKFNTDAECTEAGKALLRVLKLTLIVYHLCIKILKV